MLQIEGLYQFFTLLKLFTLVAKQLYTNESHVIVVLQKSLFSLLAFVCIF